MGHVHRASRVISEVSVVLNGAEGRRGRCAFPPSTNLNGSEEVGRVGCNLHFCAQSTVN